MYVHLLLDLHGQEGSPKPPRVRPVSEASEPKVEDWAPVQWVAKYVTRDDTVTAETAVLVFSDIDKAASYAGVMLADGRDVAIIGVSDKDIQEYAFGGDPNGLCIVDPEFTHPPGLPVKVSKLAEWFRTAEQSE